MTWSQSHREKKKGEKKEEEEEEATISDMTFAISILLNGPFAFGMDSRLPSPWVSELPARPLSFLWNKVCT